MAAGTSNRIEKIRLNVITIDGRVQRTLNLGRVKEIGESFDWDAFGTPTLSRRDDGTIVIIDGQHRVMGARHAGYEDRAPQFRVFEGLTLEEEAKLFKLLNNTRKPGPIDLFNVAVVAREVEAIQMNKLIESVGMKVQYAGNKAFRSVSSLAALWEVDPVSAERAVRMLTDAWGAEASAVQAQLLTGLGRALIRYQDAVSTDAMVTRLAKYPGGAHAMIGAARGLSRISSISVADAVSTIMVKEYNKTSKGRSAKLADWTDEVR